MAAPQWNWWNISGENPPPQRRRLDCVSWLAWCKWWLGGVASLVAPSIGDDQHVKSAASAQFEKQSSNGIITACATTVDYFLGSFSLGVFSRFAQCHHPHVSLGFCNQPSFCQLQYCAISYGVVCVLLWKNYPAIRLILVSSEKQQQRELKDGVVKSLCVCFIGS